MNLLVLNPGLKIEDRIEAIEKELAQLKMMVSPRKRLRVVKISGILKGLDASKESFDEAKKSLFKHATC